jgi:lysophospholipase L1-like esterase
MDIFKHWNPDTFDTSTYGGFLNKRKNSVSNTCSLDESGINTYTFNELGFRGDSIHSKGYKIMSIGCSMTEGIGVSDNETWNKIFSDLMGGINLNFGVGGASNDYISRCLISFYDFIKPDLVIITYTHAPRREVHTVDNGVEPFMITHKWGFLNETKEGRTTHQLMAELQNNNSDFVNWYKNHLIIKNFLENRKSKWIWNGEVLLLDKQYTEHNRFDSGILKFYDMGTDGTHPGPLTHKLCAENLYNFIKHHTEDI